jgi:ABC-type phosphate/phosphonate transport system substrate-binding protein
LARASLFMYDLPEIAGANEALWAAIARECRARGMRDVPSRVERGGDHVAAWLAPDLFFSQTCGYPLTHALEGKVRLIGTPVYRAIGCRGASYRSFLVVAASNTASDLGAFRGRIAAVNSLDSQSGYNVLKVAVAAIGGKSDFFSGIDVTGGHLMSLQAVQRGAAEIAAIDCITHALLARHRPSALAGTRVLAETRAAPGLPFITTGTASEEDVVLLKASLRAALASPDVAASRQALLLDGVEDLDRAAYQAIPDMEEWAAERGCATLGEGEKQKK